jgi:hypothetical protein
VNFPEIPAYRADHAHGNARSANVAALVAIILLFLVPYWRH